MDTPYRSHPENEPLKVRGDTPLGSFAKSLTMTLAEQNGRVLVRAMGPAAVNQMIKGLIRAQQQLASQGKRLAYTHGFATHVEDGVELTAIQAVCTLSDL